MMGDFLSTLPIYALWLIAGLLLVSAEMLLPGLYLLYIGIAALLTGAIAWALPIGIEWQFTCFALLAIASVFVGRRWTSSNAIASDDPLLNDRIGRLIGSQVVLVEAIVGGHGRARVGDSEWSVAGKDAPVGSQMRITGAQGNILTVEPI